MAQASITTSAIVEGQPQDPAPIKDALDNLETAVNNIDSTQLGTGCVGSTQLATNAVTAVKVLDGIITNAKLASEVKTGISTTSTTRFGVIPTGGILDWPTVTAPTGWLLCNGQAVSRDTYSGLYAVISTTFGAGDSSTTFNVPNYTNRTSIGAGDTYTLAGAGTGAHTHTGPSHTHGSSLYVGWDADSNYIYWDKVYSTFTASARKALSGAVATTGWDGRTGTGVGGTIDAGGTGASGSTVAVPPYLATYKIIKA